MFTSIRIVGPGFVVAGLLMCIATMQSSWLDIGTRAGDRDHSGLVSEADPACTVALKRIASKQQVIDRLLIGELTLFEAAAWFRYLNQEPPEYADRRWTIFPGDTDEEKLCRQVIAWASIPRGGSYSDSEIEQIAARLEADLTARLCQSGRIDLLTDDE